MNEKSYKKKIEAQNKIISHKSKQIEDLESQVARMKLEIEEKNMIVNSVASLRDELTFHVAEAKKYKDESKKLVSELRKMKETFNQEVFKGRWNLVKLLIK